jgi:hypothetical protein
MRRMERPHAARTVGSGRPLVKDLRDHATVPPFHADDALSDVRDAVGNGDLDQGIASPAPLLDPLLVRIVGDRQKDVLAALWCGGHMHAARVVGRQLHFRVCSDHPCGGHVQHGLVVVPICASTEQLREPMERRPQKPRRGRGARQWRAGRGVECSATFRPRPCGTGPDTVRSGPRVSRQPA